MPPCRSAWKATLSRLVKPTSASRFVESRRVSFMEITIQAEIDRVDGVFDGLTILVHHGKRVSRECIWWS
jgi:hypothetical protein